jgi:hypothetical protein
MSKKLMMVGLMLLLVMGAATGVYAQSGTSGGTGSGSGTAGGDTGTTYSDTDRDNGPDFGWIGLLGLAGLMGLKRREVHRDARSTTTAPVR